MNLMTTLVQLPFNWIKQHKKNLVNNLLGHISKLASTDTEMIKSTLELLKVIHYYFFIFFNKKYKGILDSPTKELSEFSPAQQKSLL
jgi:hypothetical protein